MASRMWGYWRSLAARRSLTTATTPRMKSMGSAAMEMGDHHTGIKPRDLKGEFMPIYVMAGFVGVALCMAAHTAKQQLVHSPGVRVSKKRRETVAEVDYPDRVARESDRFVNKSFLRKVAHMQDFDSVRSGITDPTRPNPFTRERTVESLRSIGVNPTGH